ncbi:MAG: oxygenase MpaB family protein [Chloroflexota bacterium]|nr:oxygenase MpaB family protein [Chloroflexota bacterium]
MNIPSYYASGYEKARELNPELADNYAAHMTIGDPAADAAIADLLSLEPSQIARLIQAGVDRDAAALRDAPPRVRDFFEMIEAPPDWVNTDGFIPGIRMFHRNSSLILGAFVGGTLVEGFSTNIAKPFFITGRLRESAVRRLRQNNRQMFELFLPGGLERDGDGWKLSVRVRLVHARIRHLLTDSFEWDDAWGTPLSAAHMGFAITAFSVRLVRHMRRLGCRFNDEEKESFIAVWRYAGYLMGIPETILFRGEKDALEIYQMGRMTEPEPDFESVAMANALIQSAPLVIDITDVTSRRNLAGYVYKVSRALIGNELADQLRFPDTSTMGVLTWFRLQKRYEETLGKLINRQGQSNRFGQFSALLEASMYDNFGISYALPNRLYSEESRPY